MNYKKLIVGNNLFFGRDKGDNFVVQAGTVAVVLGDATVTGTGTTFTGIPNGTILTIGGRKVVVDSVTDATHLELAFPWSLPSASSLPWWKNVDNSIDFDNPPATENDWLDLGKIEDVNFNPKRTEAEIYSPNPGSYDLSDILIKSKELGLEFTLQEVTEFMIEMLTASIGPIVDDYQPFTASGALYGWFRVGQFGQNNAQFNQLSVWGRATADATKFGNDPAKGKVNVRCLSNPKTSGTLALAVV